jgi:kynurenine formamidase
MSEAFCAPGFSHHCGAKAIRESSVVRAMGTGYGVIMKAVARRSGLLLFLSSLSLFGGDLPFTGGKWIDLTHDFSTNTIFWPTAEKFSLETEFHGHTPGGYFYAANRYRASEHGGTHIDAPIHFAEGGRTVDQLPIDQLTGTAVVVNVSIQAQRDADYRVAVADLKAWEEKHGQIPKNAIVLLNTGFARRWPDAKRYLGTDEKGQGAVAKLHFPGLHPDAARWLVSERAIKAVGIDTASIDFGQSTLFESHRVLFEKNIPAFENVAGLDQLPPRGAYVVALPMKIKGGSGGPLRIVAWLPDRP